MSLLEFTLQWNVSSDIAHISHYLLKRVLHCNSGVQYIWTFFNLAFIFILFFLLKILYIVYCIISLHSFSCSCSSFQVASFVLYLFVQILQIPFHCCCSSGCGNICYGILETYCSQNIQHISCKSSNSHASYFLGFL